MVLVTSGDVLIAGATWLLDHSKEFFWIGSGLGTAQFGVFSLYLARSSMAANTDSRGADASASITAGIVQQFGPFESGASRLLVIDTVVAAAFISFDASLHWLYPVAEKIYHLGSGGGMVLSGFAATIMVIAPKKSPKDRTDFLNEYRLQLERDRIEKEMKDSTKLNAKLASKIHQLQAKLASSKEEAAHNKKMFYNATKKLKSAPIGDQSTPSDKRFDQQDRKDYAEQLELEMEELEIKREKDRKQNEM
jgi:uncharacterized membrane-anchored protein YhcB (DUF1043 family)